MDLEGIIKLNSMGFIRDNVLDHHSWINMKDMMNELMSVKASIIKLEEQIFNIYSENNEIWNTLDNYDPYINNIRIPHRCPICNGASFNEKDEACLPCDGKGIVWG